MAANPNSRPRHRRSNRSALSLIRRFNSMKKLRDGDSSPVAEPVSSVVLTATPPFAPFDIDSLPTDTFFGMTIADAAVKFLGMVGRNRNQRTQSSERLERGGLMDKKYGTVYAILNRRAERQRDIVNVHGDWGLTEWYGTPRKPRTMMKVLISGNDAESRRFQEDFAAVRGIKRTGIEPPIDSDGERD